MIDATEAPPELRVAILAQRFLLPFAFAGRWPTQSELTRFLESVAAEGASDEDMDLLAQTMLDISNEAALIMRTRGTA